MRRRDRIDDLLKAEDWDLLVLDEAHHARRRAPGSPQEGGPNRLLRLMLSLKDKARSLVLLTATPMQVHPVEVWDLLNLLGMPPRWAASKDDFVRYFRLSSGNPGQVELEFLALMFRDVEATFGRVDEEMIGRTVPAATPLTRQRILKALRERDSGIPLKRAQRGRSQDRAGNPPPVQPDPLPDVAPHAASCSATITRRVCSARRSPPAAHATSSFR